MLKGACWLQILRTFQCGAEEISVNCSIWWDYPFVIANNLCRLHYWSSLPVSFALLIPLPLSPLSRLSSIGCLQFIVECHGSTLLPQFLGMYRLTVDGVETYMVVTRNVFSHRLTVHRKYDLKVGVDMHTSLEGTNRENTYW